MWHRRDDVYFNPSLRPTEEPKNLQHCFSKPRPIKTSLIWLCFISSMYPNPIGQHNFCFSLSSRLLHRGRDQHLLSHSTTNQRIVSVMWAVPYTRNWGTTGCLLQRQHSAISLRHHTTTGKRDWIFEHLWTGSVWWGLTRISFSYFTVTGPPEWNTLLIALRRVPSTS